MFIKRLDYISPPVTFYHHGYLSHSSILSGILSIIAIILIIILGIYFSLELIERQNPKAFSYNSFVDDAGIYPLNASSLFHFIRIATAYTYYLNEGVDFTNFRIIGFETYYEFYIYQGNLSSYDHWLYGKCDNITDTKGISHLVNYDFFEDSACIKKFFSTADQQYYNIGEPNFRWPEISHGTINPNYTLYSIVIEPCQQDTLDLILGEGYQCKNNTEYFQYLNNFGVAYIYLINNYINLLNYENPSVKFFFSIEGILSKYEYSINNMNFNPSKIKTHNGLIFDNIKEEISYIYDRNDVKTDTREGKDIYAAYVFWLKNNMNYNERTYKRIQDIVSDIGGIYQAITIISIFINSLYNNYIILYDTESILFSSINEEKNKIKKKDKKKSIKELKNEEKNNNNNDFAKSFDKEKLDAKLPYNKNRKNKIDNSNNNNISKSNTNCINSFQDLNFKSRMSMNKFENDNIENKKPKGKKNFWNFLLFKLSCGKKDNCFKVYNDFRIKIISEEHLIKNHLNIYNILKVTEKKRNYRRNSYQLKDLIKLI